MSHATNKLVVHPLVQDDLNWSLASEHLEKYERGKRGRDHCCPVANHKQLNENNNTASSIIIITNNKEESNLRITSLDAPGQAFLSLSTLLSKTVPNYESLLVLVKGTAESRRKGENACI